MWCKYCNKSLSNQFSYNRHCESDTHIHNLQNPYYILSDYFHIDLLNLIWEFTYIQKGKVLDYLESGNKWKAYDIIRSRKMLPLCYTLVDIDGHSNRIITFTKYNAHHIHCTIIAGEYYLDLHILDSEYVWTKLANIKDAAIKHYIFGSDKINDMINILH